MEIKKRIKVLFITKWFMNRHDPQLGVFIRKHASAAALHCDVALLCVLSDESQKNLIELEEKEEFNIRSFVVYFRKFNSSIPFINTFINFLRYIKANNVGLKEIEKKFGRHDITHAYIMLRPAMVAWWLKLTRGIPFVISEQWSGYATGKFSGKNSLTKTMYRYIFRKADAATAVSEFLKSKMEIAGLKNNYSITPNVIEPVARKISPLPENGKIKVLTVADLVDEIKNISATIRVIAEISQTNKQIEFHIIGHGKDEMMLKDLARSLNVLDVVVFFHGVKTNEEVFQYLYASQFLVMNSRFETFSLICIEAMACGIPVIATRCGGPDEFIIEETGILIEPGKPDQLRHAIERMITGYKSYDSSILVRFATTCFRAAQTGKKMEEIYIRLLAH